MWLLPLAVPLGMVVGRLAGGRWRYVYKVRIRWWGVLVAAIAVGGFMAVYPDPPGGDAWLAFSLVLFAVVAGANLHLRGMGVVMVGIGLNLVPLLLNGHMPVRAEAVVDAGLAPADNYEAVDLGTGRQLAEPGDRLTVLGPIVPLSALNEVVSFGDLIVAFGLVNVGFRLVKPAAAPTRRRRPAHAARGRGDGSSAPPSGDDSSHGTPQPKPVPVADDASRQPALV
jgi:Family of unknown function (DUF5317)